MNIGQLKKTNIILQKANDALEKKVEELSSELLKAKKVQQQEIERRKQAQLEKKSTGEGLGSKFSFPYPFRDVFIDFTQNSKLRSTPLVG